MSTSRQNTATPQVYYDIVMEVPKLRRGQVWCKKCGQMWRIDSAYCLAHGWPRHCGEQMTIDAPDER